MLVPITRQKFEQVIPILATGPQYAYFWGKFSAFIRRLLISVIAVVIVLILGLFLGEGFGTIRFLLAIIAALYWLWTPIYWATRRNLEVRRYKYSGFWRGQVLDVFVTEELIGTEENVNKRGELVIVENRERRLNLDVGDETGFETQLQVSLRRTHKGIAPGQIAEMLVMSNQSDLGRINKTSDVYIPSLNLWVSEYPYVQHDIFAQVSHQLSDSREGNNPKRRVTKTKRRSR